MDWIPINIILFNEAILVGIIAYCCLPQDDRDHFQQWCLECVKKHLPQYDHDCLRQLCLEFVKKHIVDEAPKGPGYD